MSDNVASNYEEMAASITSARSLIRELKSKPNNTSDGISLLSLKNHLLLNYIQSMLLVSCRRALGHRLDARNPPVEAFSSLERDARGDGVGDLADSMIEGRIALEKTKVLEGRMRYQIDKLVRLAKDGDAGDGVVNDPLAFRPNPANLVDNDDDDDNEMGSGSDNERGARGGDGIYHAPRLAPVPYLPPTSKNKRDKTRAPVPTSLHALRDADPSLPYTESTSGMGSTPSLNAQSSRARYLKQLNEFEEEQFGRVMLGKKESRRRMRDEETLAMGGALSGVGEEGKGRVRRNRNLEDEFADVLRDVDRPNKGGKGGDGYDELRQRGKRGTVLERSRKVTVAAIEDLSETNGKRKRSRFEMERKAVKKRK